MTKGNFTDNHVTRRESRRIEQWLKPLAINLRFIWPLACVDFGRAQIRTQLNAIFFTVWPPNTTSRHRLDSKSSVYAWNFRVFATWMNLRGDLRGDLRIPLATLRKAVGKFWFCKLALTCVDVQVRLASGFREFLTITSSKCWGNK